MLNKTSSFYHQKIIEFGVMGLSREDSDFLNWCMQNRDNLEWIKNHDIMGIESGSVVLYFDDLKKIRRSDKTIVERG